MRLRDLGALVPIRNLVHFIALLIPFSGEASASRCFERQNCPPCLNIKRTAGIMISCWRQSRASSRCTAWGQPFSPVDVCDLLREAGRHTFCRLIPFVGARCLPARRLVSVFRRWRYLASSSIIPLAAVMRDVSTDPDDERVRPIAAPPGR